MSVVTRKLFLEQRSSLGQPAGADSFRLHWEFWLQLRMIAEAQGLTQISPHVADAQAFDLVTLIEGKATDEGWIFHMEMWGDSDGASVASLCQFLQGGGFEVVDLTK